MQFRGKKRAFRFQILGLHSAIHFEGWRGGDFCLGKRPSHTTRNILTNTTRRFNRGESDTLIPLQLYLYLIKG